MCVYIHTYTHLLKINIFKQQLQMVVEYLYLHTYVKC